MLIKSTLTLFAAIFIGFVVSPSYGGDIISCDSFENCPDGSVPLTNALLQLEAKIDALAVRTDALETENTALEALVTTLQTQLVANTAADATAHHDKYTNAEAVAAVGPHFSGNHADLTNVVADQHHTEYTDADSIAAVGPHSPDYSALLENVSRGVDPNTSQDTLTFTDMNVQIVSGSGTTSGTTTGTGNLIIGYNEPRGDTGCPAGVMCDRRDGSHMLVVGSWNNYTSYGGMSVGRFNETSAPYASVSGGNGNTARGDSASVSGGNSNTASGNSASVSGGVSKTAATNFCVVGDNGVDC